MKILLDFYEQIVLWPAIIQGALGSTLFAAIVFLGKRTISLVVPFLEKHNKKFRKERLYAELFHKKYLSDKDHRVKFISICLYQAFTFFIKGLILFLLGYLLGQFNNIFSLIGTALFLVYLIRASLWLDPFVVESKESKLQIWHRICDIEQEIHGKPAEDTLKKIEELSSNT